MFKCLPSVQVVPLKDGRSKDKAKKEMRPIRKKWRHGKCISKRSEESGTTIKLIDKKECYYLT